MTSLRASSEASRTYAYDLRGGLTSVELPGEATHAIWAYDAAGQLSGADLPGGAVVGYGYDADGLLASICTTLSSGVLARAYGRDDAGRIITENAERFAYDAAGRLTSWYDPSTDATKTYGYDAASNLTEVAAPGSAATTFSVDGTGRITSPGFAYDGRGNLACDGRWRYAYDAANRLSTVRDAGTDEVLATYAYDAANRRVRAVEGTVTTVFHYEGASGRVIAETDGAGTTLATYAYGPGGRLHAMTRGGQTYYYHLSARGDVIALSDSSGEIVNEYRYDPWGRLLSASETVGNAYRYAGYRYDVAGQLYYCWNRHYAPALGRFLQRDLYPGELTRPASMNPYAYCEGDPVNAVDPGGLYAFGSGVQGSIQGGNVGYGETYQVVGVSDGTVGILRTRTFQPSPVPNGAAGVQVQFNTADKHHDLEDWAAGSGGSVSCVGGDWSGSRDSDGGMNGSVAMSLGKSTAPAESHTSVSYSDFIWHEDVYWFARLGRTTTPAPSRPNPLASQER